MHLSRMTWKEVQALGREEVVLIPTGSVEQHGSHLPVFTDSMLATAVAEAVEAALPEHVLLTPTHWLGASAHHLGFAGTLTAGFADYMTALHQVVDSLKRHGFWKFFIVNAHGGNSEPNGIVCRQVKHEDPKILIGHANYYTYAAETIRTQLEGPFKEIRHACEAETSLMLHLFPSHVRSDLLRDDGLTPDPPVRGMSHPFNEITQEGSLGFATLASAAKGKAIFEAARDGLVIDMRALSEGYVLRSVVP